jgi:hypothetical protein
VQRLARVFPRCYFDDHKAKAEIEKRRFFSAAKGVKATTRLFVKVLQDLQSLPVDKDWTLLLLLIE